MIQVNLRKISTHFSIVMRYELFFSCLFFKNDFHFRLLRHIGNYISNLVQHGHKNLTFVHQLKNFKIDFSFSKNKTVFSFFWSSLLHTSIPTLILFFLTLLVLLHEQKIYPFNRKSKHCRYHEHEDFSFSRTYKCSKIIKDLRRWRMEHKYFVYAKLKFECIVK
jgi:hypothetical protein